MVPFFANAPGQFCEHPLPPHLTPPNTPTRPHPRSPPNPNQLPPHRPLSPPPPRCPHRHPLPVCSPARVHRLERSPPQLTAAGHGAARRSKERRDTAARCEVEPNARGRSWCGSTSTVPMEDSGRRRGTKSGATLWCPPPPHCSSSSRIRARDNDSLHRLLLSSRRWPWTTPASSGAPDLARPSHASPTTVLLPEPDLLWWERSVGLKLVNLHLQLAAAIPTYLNLLPRPFLNFSVHHFSIKFVWSGNWKVWTM
jgi:hypothetical protein